MSRFNTKFHPHFWLMVLGTVGLTGHSTSVKAQTVNSQPLPILKPSVNPLQNQGERQSISDISIIRENATNSPQLEQKSTPENTIPNNSINSNSPQLEQNSTPQNNPSETPSSQGMTLDSLGLNVGETTLTPEQQPTEVPPLQVLTPKEGDVLDQPATSIMVQFRKGLQVEVTVNGVTVDSKQLGKVEEDPKTNTVLQTWYGVTLQAGKNIVTVRVLENGQVIDEISRSVNVRGIPKSLKLETVETRIPADGRSTATVIGTFLDENGNRSNWDSIVTLTTSEGEYIGVDLNPDLAGFQIQAKQGEFRATLRSGIRAGTVRLSVTANDTLQAFTQIQFSTMLRRDTLMSGVVDLRWGSRGTDYYGSFRDFLPADQNYNTELEAHSAFFLTGSLGSWQYTGAYNTDRTLNDSPQGNRLYRNTQPSELQYPIYGDSSQVQNITPSQDQVYLKLERNSSVTGADPDYFMWGDYGTQEFTTASQEYSATSRQLHGFKSNYSLGNLQLTGLYAINIDGFQRDTITPDGTSGYYFLSRRLVIPGSEEVFIETEELDRPGTVLKREKLTRISDYEIDFDRGTLLFKQPIYRTDVNEVGNILVHRIVTTYQYENTGEEKTHLIGGRIRYHVNYDQGHETWLGASYLQEDKGDRDFELYGLDAYVSIGNNSHLIAEYAHSQNDSLFTGPVSGSAYRFELESQFNENYGLQAFYRTTDAGFANQATTSFVPGQTRYGASVIGKLSPDTQLRVSYDHEDNFGVAPRIIDQLEEFLNPTPEAIPGSRVDNSLTTITAGLQQRWGKATVNMDYIWRDRQDRLQPFYLNGSSSQLRTMLSYPITSRLSFRAINEMTLSSAGDAVYGDRTALGLNWELLKGINLTLSQQWFQGGQQSRQSGLSAGISGNYSLGTDTSIMGRYNLVSGLDGMTMEGALGLKQSWAITPGLRLNFGYEHLFQNSFNRTGVDRQFQQPFAFGQSASGLGFNGGDSYNIGLEYVDPSSFKFSAKYDHRDSSQGSNTVLSLNAGGNITPGLSALFNYNQADSANQGLEGLGTTRTLRLGMAYRDPHTDVFNALVRYEYRENPSTIPESILIGSGTGSKEHLFAGELIYAPNWQWEFYGKYATRFSTTYLAGDYVGNTNVWLGQLRTTYRVNYNLELVGELRSINQPSAGYSEFGGLLEAGYYLTPSLRLSAGYAVGDISDRDFSGSRSAGGSYLGLTFKLDSLFNSFGEPRYIAPPQNTESKITN